MNRVMDHMQICLGKQKGLFKAFYSIFAFDNALNRVEISKCFIRYTWEFQYILDVVTKELVSCSLMYTTEALGLFWGGCGVRVFVFKKRDLILKSFATSKNFEVHLVCG